MCGGEDEVCVCVCIVCIMCVCVCVVSVCVCRERVHMCHGVHVEIQG